MHNLYTWHATMRKRIAAAHAPAPATVNSAKTAYDCVAFVALQSSLMPALKYAACGMHSTAK